MIYIISQIIGLVAFAISLIAYHKKDKKIILESMLVSNILNLFHYFLLGAFSGCITKLLAIFRDYFIILKEKNKKFSNIVYLILFLLLYIIVTIFTYNGVLSILPLVAAIIYIIFIWNGDELKIKKQHLFVIFFG